MFITIWVFVPNAICFLFLVLRRRRNEFSKSRVSRLLIIKSVHLFSPTHSHRHTCTHMCTQTHVHICACKHMHTQTHVHIHACKHMRTHAYTHAYVCRQTHQQPEPSGHWDPELSVPEQPPGGTAEQARSRLKRGASSWLCAHTASRSSCSALEFSYE